MFRELVGVINEIERQGFDPGKETYSERMADVNMPPKPNNTQGQSIPGNPKARARQLFKNYAQEGEARSSFIMAGEGSRLYGLDKEKVEMNLPFTEGKLDRDEQGNIKYKPVNVDKGALDQIKVIEQNGEVQYASELSSNASKIPEEYYSGVVGSYDPVQNAYGLQATPSSSFGKTLRDYGEGKLKYIIENELTDEQVKKYGFTKDQLLNMFVELKEK